ncbi:unnamed protein product [Boreogadus saida]
MRRAVRSSKNFSASSVGATLVAAHSVSCSASGVLDGDLMISAGMFESDLPRTASPPPLLSLRSAGRRSQLGVGEKERCRSSKANSGCTSLLGPKAV